MKRIEDTEENWHDLYDIVSPVVQQFLLEDTSRITKKKYRRAMKRWTLWAKSMGYTTVPASPAHLAEYFADAGRTGECYGTMRIYAAAIAMFHRRMGAENPVRGPALLELARHRRRSGDDPGRVDGLTRRHLSTIRAKALKAHRRRGDCGSFSRAAAEMSRWTLTDIALLSVMRDARLHAADGAALLWSDILEESDGTGVVTVRADGTDPEDDIIRPVSAETLQALRAMDPGAGRDGKVFNLDECRIDARIRDAAQRAGLVGNFNGDSPRLGKALDQVMDGLGLEEQAAVR